MNWLFKEEPSSYSFQEFTRDGRTVWAGVKNPLAQKHLRSVKKGDRIFYYHTGNEKAVIGIARAAGDAYPDPTNVPSGCRFHPRCPSAFAECAVTMPDNIRKDGRLVECLLATTS